MLGQPLAASLGGGPSEWESELYALLDAYAPAWDAGEDTESYAEVEALALGVAMIWAVNQRRQDWFIPSRMMESLLVFEKACNIRPLLGATLQARRQAIAARFLGFAGNSLAQLYAVCSAMAGALFLGFAVDTSPTSYMPGINPGPPGFEWMSTRACLAVRLQKTGVADAIFMDLVRRLRVELHALCPAWMTFTIGTDEGGFVAGVGIAGVTLL